MVFHIAYNGTKVEEAGHRHVVVTIKFTLNNIIMGINGGTHKKHADHDGCIGFFDKVEAVSLV